MLLILFNFIVTFIVFPGVTNYVELTFMELRAYWHEILFITTFNIVDTIGRYIGSMPCSLTTDIKKFWGILGVRFV